MKFTTLSFTLLLACAGSAWSQSGAPVVETPVLRPLNLAVRKAQTSDAQALQSRRPEPEADSRAAEVLDELPYGSGYDSRQSGVASGAGKSAGSGFGGGAGGGGGSGGGGRGRR